MVSKSRRQVFIVGILTLAACVPLVVGVFGIGQPGHARVDMGYYHSAGRCWLAGANPYIFKNLNAHNVGPPLDPDALPAFAYPPTISLFVIGYGLLPRVAADALCAALNFVTLIGLAYVTYRLTAMPRDDGSPGIPMSSAWVPAVLVLAGPYASVVIWGGNFSLIVTLLLVVGWAVRYRGHPVLAGVMVAMATIKPQLALLPFLWMALSPGGGWKFVASFVVTALILSSGALVTVGLIPTATTWIDSVATYKHANFVTLGHRYLAITTGLQSLLAAVGMKDPPDMTFLAVGLVALIFVKRRRFLNDDVLPILLMVSLGVTIAHSYDFVALAPAYAAFWRHVRGRPVPMVVFLGLIGLLDVPRAFLRVVLPNVAILWQWRTIIDLVLLGWLVALNLSTRPRSEGPTITKTEALGKL